jgi:hypothetical protein
LLSYTVSGLKSGFNHRFKVKSVNVIGESLTSSASAQILTALLPQDAPTGLTLIARSQSEMTFEWTAPEEKGGVQLSSYTIYMAKGDGVFDALINTPAEANPSITLHTESDLEASELYRFKISSSNSVGEGPVSTEIVVIAADMPSTPSTSPIITLVTESSISVTLTALTTDKNGGSEITGYIVQMDDGLGGDFIEVHNSLALTFVLTQLEASRFYRIRYAARNILWDADNMYECDQL